jgi:hypothetical protein
VAFPLLAVFLISPLLWQQGAVYQIATLAQTAFYLLALCGLLLRGMHLKLAMVFTVPFYFCLVNAAALQATVNVIRGNRILLWEPQRENAMPPDVSRLADPSDVSLTRKETSPVG